MNEVIINAIERGNSMKSTVANYKFPGKYFFREFLYLQIDIKHNAPVKIINKEIKK